LRSAGGHCRLEDPCEINHPDSQLIIQVDSNKKDEITEGILTALSRPRGTIQLGLERFYLGGFKAKLNGIITEVIQMRAMGAGGPQGDERRPRNHGQRVGG